jgi:hypothetical protein
MEFMTEMLAQVIILIIAGIVFSFIIWKLKKRNVDFGNFLNKYGEMLAYAGLLFIAFIIITIQWLS